MPAEEVNGSTPSVARSDRRIARRDRTKSPQLKVTAATECNGSSMNENFSSNKGSTEGESSSEGVKPERRKSAINITASSLLEKVKESSAPSITRLRRTNTSDGGITREGIRTLSQGHARANGRRVHDGNEALALHMSMDALNFDPKDMDASGLSNSNGMSQSRGGRRKAPARTRSMQDYGPPRGHPGTQRAPRARRKPGRPEDEPTEENPNTNSMDNSNVVRRHNTMDSSSMRRKPPPRSRSAHDAGPVPPRGAHQRMARPGRRRPGRDVPDDEETVLISDSDEEEPKHNSMDRSMPAMSASHNHSRRRPLQRTRSAQESLLPRGHAGYQRSARAARRRPSNGDDNNGEEAPTRRGAGGAPGLRRCNTGTPLTSGSGPGLMRSNTTQNSRSNRARGGRNTAKELARVANSRSQDASPSGSGSRSPSPGIETEALSANRASNSPVRSRQARRRLREDKEREGLERTLQGSVERDEPKPKPEKKDDPVWMKRLKKNVVKSNDDSFSFDEAAAQLDLSRSNENNNSGTRVGGGSSLPRMGESEDFFHTDPSFGIFPVSKADAMYQSSIPETRKSQNLDEKQLKKEQKGAMMGMSGDKGKMDFSTIS